MECFPTGCVRQSQGICDQGAGFERLPRRGPHFSCLYAGPLWRGLGGCRSGYKLAIKLKPVYATLHLWDAWHLMMMGKANEGIVEFRKVDSL
jgi:hypothetical protein